MPHDMTPTARGRPMPDPAGVQLRQSRNAPPTVAPAARPPQPGAPGDPRFCVRVMDNAVNTYQEVIAACRAALGVSPEEAFAIAQAIDTLGSCVVCEAPAPEARRVAEIIGAIGIEVRLEPVDAPAPVPS